MLQCRSHQLALLLAGALVPACALNLTITVSSPLQSASSLGIQSALTSIASAGGGTLKLTGSGSVLVDSLTSLNVGSNTTLEGDPAQSPYGMTIVGANDTGLSYRSLGYPLLNINGASNVTIWNLDFEGNVSGQNLCAPAISITNGSSPILITYNKINYALTRGVVIENSTGVTVQYLSLFMNRSWSGSIPEGGTGIYCLTCASVTLQNNYVSASDYYFSGPPTSDPRTGSAPSTTTACVPNPNCVKAATMDVVAFYAGSNNNISSNTIQYSNTAGVYLAAYGGVNETGTTIASNTISYMRQSGLDIAPCTNCYISGNSVSYSDLANLSLYTCSGGTVTGNTLSIGGRWLDGLHYNDGSLSIRSSTTGVSATYNYIYGNAGGTSGNWAVWFDQPAAGYPYPQSNSVSNNDLWSGRPTGNYTGGNYTGWNTLNTLSGNTNH
jgi:Right handed beta helix region